MSTKDNWMEFLAGLFVGAAVGCTTTLLIAPKSGRQFRKSISSEARRLGAKTYYSCGGDLNELRNLVEAEAAENLENNIENIRSAGL